MKAPKDVPAELAPLYEVPLLNKEQEQHLFRKMNYLKYKASKLRNDLRKDGNEAGVVDPGRVRIQLLKEIEDLQSEANAVKDQLIKANMRLVVNIAKKHVSPVENVFELLSDGNMSLILLSRNSITVAASSSALMQAGQLSRILPAAFPTRNIVGTVCDGP